MASPLSLIQPAQTAEQFAARQSWQYRCVEATAGNTTKLGAILLGVLGKPRDKRAFGASGAIVEGPDGGHVLSAWTDRDGNKPVVVRVCSINELTANFSGLADHLQLNDADRIALFQAVRTWIATDERAIKENLHFTKTR